jgi:arylsulfatase A-like enzyme
MSISRRSFLHVAAAQVRKNRPNVLMVFADDMSYRTIRSLNNPEIRTPNLDKLVARGTAFTHACILGELQPAVCVPSRAMLMSGQNTFHVTANIENEEGMR